VHGRGAAAGAHLFEEQAGGHAEQAEEREEAEVVDVSQQRRLPHERLIHRTVGLLSSGHNIAVR